MLANCYCMSGCWCWGWLKTAVVSLGKQNCFKCKISVEEKRKWGSVLALLYTIAPAFSNCTFVLYFSNDLLWVSVIDHCKLSFKNGNRYTNYICTIKYSIISVVCEWSSVKVRFYYATKVFQQLNQMKLWPHLQHWTRTRHTGRKLIVLHTKSASRPSPGSPFAISDLNFFHARFLSIIVKLAVASASATS